MKLIIGFSKPKNKIFPFFSWLIRLWDGTPYSHVYIRWNTSKNDKICYQASRGMVHFVGEKIFNKTIQPIQEFEFEIDENTYNKMVSFCIQNAGVSYGVLQILGIVFGDIFKRNILSSGTNAYVCSELVGIILRDKLLISIDKNLDLVTPKDIYNVCKLYGKSL